MAATECLHALDNASVSTLKADMPDVELEALESKLALLADIFATVPHNFDHKLPDDPASYAEVMPSPHAHEWTLALQEFDSLCDLDIQTLHMLYSNSANSWILLAPLIGRLPNVLYVT
jgi:hypothetical protein